ncbi:MAG: lipid-A-disaccharide synthase [Candidatus Zhuqueibacterota bacterium]
MSYKVMIIAGEASGDLHASGLVRAMLRREPGLEVFGIGGDRMRELGVRLLHHISEMSVLGFVDVLKHIRFFKRVYHKLVAAMDEERPNLLILIDYPGLNLKLATAARARGINVLYYIAPQVWAWGAGRIKHMAQCVDKMAVILPFEEQLYRSAGIDATFVGHPLLEVVRNSLEKEAFQKQHALEVDQKTIGLLPGSRHLEVKRLLPEMLRVVEQLRADFPGIQAIIGQADTVEESVYRHICSEFPEAKLVTKNTYNIMKFSDALIVASGTATLESALFATPMIIVYKVDAISYLIGRQLVKIDSIGLVNVIAGKKIVPEFIQGELRASGMAPVMKMLLSNREARIRMMDDLRKIREKLGEPGASDRTAAMAMELIRN